VKYLEKVVEHPVKVEVVKIVKVVMMVFLMFVGFSVVFDSEVLVV